MKKSLVIVFLLISLTSFFVEAKEVKKYHKSVPVKTYKVHKAVKHTKKPTDKSVGVASWYGYESVKKRIPKTANGDVFLPNKMTAAHRSLPFGTKVKVTNLENNKSVIVVINDRGPYIYGRIIDLSKGAARAIGINGIQKVKLTVLT